MTSKLPKIRIFDPFGGPALPIWGGGRIFLMHEIHCKTSNLNDTSDIITECMANHAKTEKKTNVIFLEILMSSPNTDAGFGISGPKLV